MCQMNGRLELLSSTLSTEMQTGERITYHNGNPSDHTQDMRCIDYVATASQRSRASGNSALQTRSKTSWTSINAGLALLSFQTTSTMFYDVEDSGDDETSTIRTKKTFTFNFLWGYSSCRRGVRISTNSSFDSLTLNAIRRRPYDSQIFMLCEEGDTMGVEKLLQTGDASLYDTDEDGYGLLHVSAIILS
jgi:hypothetical protein